jgi:uncharacterized membrane protein
MDDKLVSKKKGILLSLAASFIAGLCCFSPVVLVLLGLSTASVASGFADTLYGDYKWYFRSAGFVFLAAAFVFWYFQKKKSCPLDQRARLRRKMLNLFLISCVVFIVAYVIWLYVIVEFLGVQLGIWDWPV